MTDLTEVPDVPDGAASPRFLTVGIPVHNGRALLRSCLTSVVTADFPHERYEVVVADDGSTEPETLAVLDDFSRRFAAEPGFFRVLRSSTNSGGAARPRNRVLDVAVGEYVFFVDSDDTIGSEALARIADALAETPADWVALHQALVNGRVGAAVVRQPRMEVPRLKALTTLTVHKVFRRAEIERQGLRFDEGLPSGQDVSFAFSYLLGASRFLMLGGYDYYYLTRHAGNPDEPAHLSRRAGTPEALVEKNHRILVSMLDDLGRSGLPLAERREILGAIALPRVLVLQRYLSAVVDLGPVTGPPVLQRLAGVLAADPLVGELGPSDLTRQLSAEQLAVVLRADWAGLRTLLRPPKPPKPAAAGPPPRVRPARRWARRVLSGLRPRER